MKKSFVTLGAELEKLSIAILCTHHGLPALADVSFVGDDMLCELFQY